MKDEQQKSYQRQTHKRRDARIWCLQATDLSQTHPVSNNFSEGRY